MTDSSHTAPVQSRRSAWVWGGVLFVGSMLYLHGFIRYDINFLDEGTHLNASQRILEGEAMYRDFYAPYGPARYYLVAASFKIFGSSLLVARITWHLLLAATAVLTYRIGARLMHHWFAFAAAVYFLLVPMQHYKAYYPATYLVIVFFTLKALESGRNRSWFWVGVWGAVGFLFRYEMILVAICLPLGMMVVHPGSRREGWRRKGVQMACLLVGLAAIIVPVGAYYVATDSAGKIGYYLEMHRQQHFKFFPVSLPSIAEKWSGTWEGDSQWKSLWGLFDTSVMYAQVGLCVVAALMGGIRILRGRGGRVATALLAVGLAGMAMQPSFVARADFDHLLHVAVIIYLLVFLVADRVLRRLKESTSGSLFCRIGVSGLCLLFLIVFAFTSMRLHPTEGGTIGKRFMPHMTPIKFPRAFYYDAPGRQQEATDVRNFVETLKKAGFPPNRIAAFKFGGYWYYVLETKNPTTHEMLISYSAENKNAPKNEKGQHIGMVEEERIIESLMKKNEEVKFILLKKVYTDLPSFAEMHPMIWTYIQENFEDISDMIKPESQLKYRTKDEWTLWKWRALEEDMIREEGPDAVSKDWMEKLKKHREKPKE